MGLLWHIEAIAAEAVAAEADAGITVTTLSNGVTVVTEASTSPVATVTISVAAGSRAEGATNVGVSHVLKQMAFQATEERSSLAICRTTELAGAKLSCTNDREAISYTATFLRNDAAAMVDNLTDAVSGQLLTPWDLADAKERAALSLSNQSPQDAVMDSVHAGAFRSTLGRPVQCPAYKIGAISADDLRAFTAANYSAGNMTVMGAGVDHDDLVAQLEENLANLSVDDTPKPAANYYGGFESRVDAHTDTAHIAIAYEGVAAGSGDEAAATVLENLVAAPPATKWGAGTSANALAASVVSASPTTTFSPINYNYTDSGLFGVFLSAPAEEAGAASAAVTDGLKGVFAGNFTDEDVAKAKNQAAVSLLNLTRDERAAFVAKQCLGTKQPMTPEDMADAVAAVSAADVRAVASKIGASTATFAAAGNLAFTPYADELEL